MGKVFFPTAYTRTLAREMGLDNKGLLALLRGTRLNPDNLLELNAVIDEQAQTQIVQNALALSNNPALGLRWGANLHLAAHGPLGTLIASSPTLTHAWRATERFHNIRGGLANIQGQAEQDLFVVVLNINLPAGEVHRFFTEAVLATMVNHLGMIVGKANPALRVELAYPPPPYADKYAEYLHAPCVFDCAQSRIVIPPGFAGLPNPMADADSYELAYNRCEALLLAQRRPTDWNSRVTELLRLNPGQIWTCDQVASHFHMSSRTLLRHLQDEGTTYIELRDRELARQAQHNLQNPNNTVESVALALGYQEVSNFRRAFKRWTGMSPQAFALKHRRPG